MRKINEIIVEIERDKDCMVQKLSIPNKNVSSGLPEDLEFYLENYYSIVFFPKALYSIKIVGLTEFERANKVLIGEEHKEDISHNWFLIADDSNSQYNVAMQ
jgi:hypothetical protein